MIKKYYFTKKIDQSSGLYCPSSFIIGMGSIFNIPGDYFDYSYSRNNIEADNEALKRDWETIGKDIRRSTLAIPHE